jgi:hypothetical protein
MARTPPKRRPPRDGGIQWAKAVILIAALVVIGIVVLRSSGSSPGPTATAGGSTTTTSVSATSVGGPTTTTTLLPAAQVKVLVLNGASSTQPIAGEWTTKVKGLGYTTEPPDNATSTVSASAIYIVTPGYLPEAQALAAAIGQPSITINQTITPSAPITPTQEATANLILVIGPDLASSATGNATTTTTSASQNG